MHMENKRKSFHRGVGEFYVVKQLNQPVSINKQELTSHLKEERGERSDLVSSRLSDPLYSFVVDTGHPNGDEIHTITERAEIIIQNKRTMNVVTILFARPPQITRYWKKIRKALPRDDSFDLVMRYAKSNLDRNLNHV